VCRAILYIGDFTFSMTTGKYETASVCLDSGTYFPYACGGECAAICFSFPQSMFVLNSAFILISGSAPSEVHWSVGGISGGANLTCETLDLSVYFTVGATRTSLISQEATQISSSDITSPSTWEIVPLSSSPIFTEASTETQLKSGILENGLVSLLTNIILTSSITINGAVNHEVIVNGNGRVISGNNVVQCFQISAGSYVTLNDLYVTNGYVAGFINSGGGGLLVTGGKVNLNRCTLKMNSALSRSRPNLETGLGGALFMTGGNMTMRNCSFTKNKAGFKGGGIYSSGGSLLAVGTEFINNIVEYSESYGGAAYIDGGEANFLDGCKFYANSAQKGGALFAGGDVNVNLVDCRILSNSASNLGGGVAFLTSNSFLERCCLCFISEQ
jgi:predicted outer membrane repeat protein